MSWRGAFRRDIERCVASSGDSAWKAVLVEPGLWVLLQHRIEAALFRSALPGIVRVPVRIVMTVWHRIIELLTGVSLPCTATIGPGLRIPHLGTIVLHADAVLGADCCLSQGVTVGISGVGERRGVPRIGDRVYIGPNAVVVGRISVGSDVVIGANSVVNRDVPDHRTVLGVPAQIVSERGSEEYL